MATCRKLIHLCRVTLCAVLRGCLGDHRYFIMHFSHCLLPGNWLVTVKTRDSPTGMLAVIVQSDDPGALLRMALNASPVFPKTGADGTQCRQRCLSLFGTKDEVVCEKE